MKYDIHGDKIVVTAAIKKYIEEKLSRLDKYFEKASDLKTRVIIKVKGCNQTIEVTIPTKTFTLRNEESNTDLYAAIDLVVDKLERQIIKNKDKMQSKLLKNKVTDFNFNNIEKDDEDNQEKVVKIKKLDTKPMSEEEAILQMNMLDHSFFIYKDDETNSINVLYRRNDGNYGIIETK